MASAAKGLKTKLKTSKAALTKIISFLDAGEFTIVSLSAKLEQLKSLLPKFEAAYFALSDLYDDEGGDDDESSDFVNNYTDFEEKYYLALSRIQVEIKAIGGGNDAHGSKSRHSSDGGIRIPKVEITKFSGQKDDWIRFYESFKSIIHENPDIKAIHKFHYLLSCLSGEAFQVIDGIDLSDDNYEFAWEKLVGHYKNDKILIETHLANLFSAKKLEVQSAKALRDLHNLFVKNMNALKKLGVKEMDENVFLVYLLTSKLDNLTLKKWEEETAAEKEMPSYGELENFLTKHYHYLEAYEKKSDFSEKLPHSRETKKRVSSTFVAQERRECKICRKDFHPVFRCKAFLEKSVDGRRELVRKIGCCWQCLDFTHRASDCTGRQCSKCEQKHNYLLCNSDRGNGVSGNLGHGAKYLSSTGKTPENSVPGFTAGPPRTSNVCHASEAESFRSSASESRGLKSITIFPTCQALISDVNGRQVPARFLLDSGSGLEFISSKLAKRLSLKMNSDTLLVHGIGNGSVTSLGFITATLKSKHSGFARKIKFHVLPGITKGSLVKHKLEMENFNLPSSVLSGLADPDFNDRSKPIDGILGAKIFFEVMSTNKFQLGYGKPYLLDTAFGWVISGEYTDDVVNTKGNGCYSVSAAGFDLSEEDGFSLNKNFNRNFAEEKYCEDLFTTTLKIGRDERYIVSLPLKSDTGTLGNSMDGAIRQFHKLELKLMKNAEIREQYCKFMDEYLGMGHMEKITDSEIQNWPHYYLPHHCVIKESKTTKLRVVFNASFETDNGSSLNSISYAGGALQTDIFDILIAFRIRKFGITSDIAKMYRQFWVDPSQTDLQRIVWRSTPDQPLEHYRLKTITYGTTSAPFLAIRCLRQCADEIGSFDPQVADKIRTKFFVDDYVDSFDTVEEMSDVQNRLEHALKTRHLELRKWCTNSVELMEKLSQNMEDHYCVDTETNLVKTLGLEWNLKSDNFTIPLRQWTSRRISKRTILADLHGFWDPLGFLVPVLIKGKMFCQSLWQIQATWDQVLPADLCDMWLKFRDRLSLLEKITVPRQVFIENPVEYSFHGFCDSSERAYGACVYVRSVNSDSNVESHLLCAKARVAPTKKVTLPRMELLGAVLLVELMKNTVSALKIQTPGIWYYTDSEIVLAWINGRPEQWKTYVSNRVAFIQESTKVGQWHHVQSKMNPADIASRGIQPTMLQEKKIWWEGPPWLVLDPSYWPISKGTLEDAPERKRVTFSLAVDTSGIANPIQQLIENLSSWQRLLDVIGFVLRFIHNAKNQKNHRTVGYLRVDELKTAQIHIIRLVQAQSFSEEIARLKAKKNLPRMSKLLSLSAFLDSDGLLKVGGRISGAGIPEGRKHPIILPYKHHVTEIILDHFHRKNLHIGSSALLTLVRGQFWPLNGKSAAKSVVHKCVLCRRANATTLKPYMADLPSERIVPGRCFETCGVDFCGPIWIKNSSRKSVQRKAYIAVFVCFTVKAIHLELVSDLTSDAFLAALKRFFSRRGVSRRIFSDNGTNFVGAQKELRVFVNNEDIKLDCSRQGVEWHFIPPGSPHMGGLWERAVRSVKTHLRKAMDKMVMTFEEAYTVLTGIEACLNSRPLTAMSDDPRDPTPLTPAHFLTGSPLHFPPEPDYWLQKTLVKRWQRLQQIQQEFWCQWNTEYLSSLQQRNKWRFPQNHIPIGTLVSIKDENLKPLEWRLARVIALHPGKDGVARVATLRLSGGQELVRPLVKLCPIVDVSPDDTLDLRTAYSSLAYGTVAD